jgi:hypothetical protein
MRFQVAIAFSVALSSLVGCGPSFEASTPSGFVELEERSYSKYDYRATTAEGVVIGVREIDNDVEGEREFWLTAIRNKMRERGGYALIKEVEVKSADGVAGTQLRFGHDDGNNKPHLYYLTVFVTPETLWLLEAGGTKELMEKEAARVQQAVSAFRTN